MKILWTDNRAQQSQPTVINQKMERWGEGQSRAERIATLNRDSQSQISGRSRPIRQNGVARAIRTHFTPFTLISCFFASLEMFVAGRRPIGPPVFHDTQQHADLAETVEKKAPANYFSI